MDEKMDLVAMKPCGCVIAIGNLFRNEFTANFYKEHRKYKIEIWTTDKAVEKFLEYCRNGCQHGQLQMSFDKKAVE